MATRTLTIGLLGAGRIGKVHAAAISGTPGARLVAVADVLPDAASALAAAYDAKVGSIDEIIADADVDAVFITTPTDVHADLIEQAAIAGKAIFCEKPIDLSVDRVRECLGVVADRKARLMVGFNRRFDPNFRAARARIDAGEIGEVEMVSITSRDPGPPPLEYMARSGGLFRDMTIHDFDMARFLLGEEPASVTAVGSVLVDPAIGGVPDIDSAAVTLVTASGKIAQISNSRRTSYGYDQRIEVHGSKGMVRADNLHESTVEVAGGHGFQRPPLMNFFIERYMPAYYAEVAAFVAAVNDGRPPQPDGESGLQALILAEAAVRSNAGRRTVDVSEI
ncbi:MAG TPA: inositol 2-dehydrogenase [Ilumatobacter sp.]|jgi:myo-inositol 2-dehydrogenase/D-chiro-inositol 1-dehydrogenase|nr:inositol 2-dehydrogenase [Ilumatobacter sp.]